MLNPVQRNPLTFLGGQPTGKKQLLAGDLLILRADDLGTHDGLVQVQNTIELSCGLGGRGEVHHCVDTLRLLLDLVCQATTAPDIDVVDGTTLVGHDLEELGQRLRGRLNDPVDW